MAKTTDLAVQHKRFAINKEKNEKKILEFLTTQPLSNTKQIAELLGVQWYTAYRTLVGLKDKGLVVERRISRLDCWSKKS
jgi:Mn-dependent DtxR family transcriptional regulator